MYEPDHELLAFIRTAAADWQPSPCAALQPQLSATTINLSKVSTSNVHSQTCIQSLTLQAAKNDLNVQKVEDVCAIIEHCLSEIVDGQFDSAPESLSAKELKKFESFKKVASFVVKRFAQNKAFYLYNARAKIGDRKMCSVFSLARVSPKTGVSHVSFANFG